MQIEAGAVRGAVGKFIERAARWIGVRTAAREAYENAAGDAQACAELVGFVELIHDEATDDERAIRDAAIADAIDRGAAIGLPRDVVLARIDEGATRG